MKGCTYLSKQQETPPKQKNTKGEQMKRKVKRVSLEWDYFVLQEQLKSLMYVERSLRGDPKKDNFIGELNFKNCMSLKRKTTIKLFVGIKCKKINCIIHP